MTVSAGIYAIKSPSGRMYVGSAANIVVRWRWHRNALARGTHHNVPLQAAYAKYGVLDYVVLELCAVKDLIAREQAYINAHPFDRLYNVAREAGSPTRGGRFSAEHRAKIAVKATGRRHTAEARARMGKSRKGVPLSREHRAKMRNAHLGRARSDIPVGASGLRGVYPVHGRWLARLSTAGSRRVDLGCFDTPEQAAAARLFCLVWRGPLVKVTA